MKHVFITGVSRGLGRAMAAGFAADGWMVSGCGTDAAALQSLADELGPDHLIQACDVTDAAAVGEFAVAVVKRQSAPDLLINNAATINLNKPLWEVAPEEFGRVMDVNLKGVHHVIRAFIPSMIRRGTGVVVNFSSGWGRSTSPEVAPYCATKWGIEGLTSALAQELSSGIAAVALNPGIIDTRMCVHASVRMQATTPLRKNGRRWPCRSCNRSEPATMAKRSPSPGCDPRQQSILFRRQPTVASIRLQKVMYRFILYQMPMKS